MHEKRPESFCLSVRESFWSQCIMRCLVSVVLQLQSQKRDTRLKFKLHSTDLTQRSATRRIHELYLADGLVVTGSKSQEVL